MEHRQGAIHVLTEGKSDWIHLKRANEILGICPSIDFHERENDGGDQALLQTCVNVAKLPQSRPTVFVFDRDNPAIVREVTAPGRQYKAWGNNVFSLAIAIPPFREPDSSVSVEWLYQDTDICKRDQHGRRLFLDTEFDERSGNHKVDPSLHVGNANRLRRGRIVDADIAVFDSNSRNVALSKSDFAANVAAANPPFDVVDFSGFQATLATLRAIAIDSGATRPEMLTPDSDEQLGDTTAVSTPQDNPPYVPIFVGRRSELKSLDNRQVRVAAITGLGGEGKSTLTARFYSLAQLKQTTVLFEKCGWCDCKGLESSFHDRLLQLLEELSDGRDTRQRYVDEHIDATIDRLVRQLHATECLIVFDNVDAYVDKDASTFTDAVRRLFDELTNSLARSLVIFTCRPPIRDHHPSFLEIPVKGLSTVEAEELVAHWGFTLTPAILSEICARTNGHALWLNLILGQLRSGRLTSDGVRQLLSTPTSIVFDLNARLMQSIWANLNAKERHILIVLSAFTRPQGIDRIERASALTYQRCVKLLRVMVGLRLVLEVEVSGATHYDLHPIIRAKARSESRSDRQQSLVTRIIAALIPGGFPSLESLIKSQSVSKQSIETYIECAEVAVENGAVRIAIEHLGGLARNLWRVGEEPKFIDLTKRLLDAIRPGDPRVGIDPTFTEVFTVFIDALLQQDEAAGAERYLAKLETGMESVAEVIAWASEKGYFLWYVNQFENAVAFSEARMNQIKSKGEEIPDDLRHHYALALRDHGRVDEAIEIFRKGREQSVYDQWRTDSSEDLASEVGNLGRSFYLKGDYAKALDYIGRSAERLRMTDGSRADKVNLGYAELWLADAYVKLRQPNQACKAIERAIDVWSVYAPARLRKIRGHVESYPVSLRERNDFGALMARTHDVRTAP